MVDGRAHHPVLVEAHLAEGNWAEAWRSFSHLRRMTLRELGVEVSMRPDEPDLVRFVNGVLEAARADGSLAASNRYWYTGRLDPLPQPPPPVYRD